MSATTSSSSSTQRPTWAHKQPELKTFLEQFTGFSGSQVADHLVNDVHGHLIVSFRMYAIWPNRPWWYGRCISARRDGERLLICITRWTANRDYSEVNVENRWVTFADFEQDWLCHHLSYKSELEGDTFEDYHGYMGRWCRGCCERKDRTDDDDDDDLEIKPDPYNDDHKDLLDDNAILHLNGPLFDIKEDRLRRCCQ